MGRGAGPSKLMPSGSYPLPWVAKLARLAFGPAVDVAQVHHNLSLGIQFDVRPVHGARCRTFEVDAFGVVSAAVARALELVLARLPVGRAAQVSADGREPG